LPAGPVADAAAELGVVPLPPEGWEADPLKRDDKSVRALWVSPTKATAYGVVSFDLPLPLGPGWTLPGFIAETQRVVGPTRLVSSSKDENSGGVQFAADLPLYKLEGVLWTRGFTGWVTYVSTEKSVPLQEAEYKAATTARDETAREGGPSR
jgi:hypothetical protein